jgi:hypothetical protein
MSRSTPPAHPVIIPATTTMMSDDEGSICRATSQPAMEKTTRPIASSIRNAVFSRCTTRAIRMVASAAPAVSSRKDGCFTQTSG